MFTMEQFLCPPFTCLFFFVHLLFLPDFNDDTNGILSMQQRAVRTQGNVAKQFLRMVFAAFLVGG